VDDERRESSRASRGFLTEIFSRVVRLRTRVEKRSERGFEDRSRRRNGARRRDVRLRGV